MTGPSPGSHVGLSCCGSGVNLGSRVFGQLVLDGVGQGQPTGLDDVLRDTDSAPDIVSILALDDDADPGGGPGPGVDDADLVVNELHLSESREVPFERLAQGPIEGIDRAVPFADRVLDVVADAELDGR